MCILCAALPGANSADILNDHHASAQGLGVGAGRGNHAPFTWDQIASQLTGGYWTFSGESSRAYALDGTRTLTYDVSRLSPAAATIAQNALGMWSAVTGINFVNVGVAPTVANETGDAAASIATGYGLSTNTILNGNIAFLGDVDYYRVTLTAGQSYVIGMSGHTAGSTLDSVLSLLDGAGNVIQSADDPTAADAGEYITYTATTSGTYFLSAAGFIGTTASPTGAYELSIQTAAKITFGDMDPSGAYAISDTVGNVTQRSYVNIADNWSTLNLNGYMLQTYLHEIGHTLGLGHAGNYNGDATWPGNALYDNDSWSATVMSYFDQDQNTNDPNGFAYLASLMPADIIAIQNIYGAGPTGSNSGNTVWGPNGNAGGYLQQLINMAAGVTPADPAIYAGNNFAFTIYDTGGTDTIDTSVFNVNQTINLNAQTSSVNYAAYSSIGGGVGNVVIARGTVIENAIGGSLDDTIIGNDIANKLEGRSGVDNISGNGGNDFLDGGLGADFLFGGEGDDTIVYDVADLAANIDGGNGTDTLLVINASAPTGFNLVAQHFEGADVQQTDILGNQAWTKIDDYYTNAWQRYLTTISFDDNSRRNTSYDYAGNQVYVTLRNDYNPSGFRTYEYFVFDNGTSRDTTFDNTPGITWSSLRQDYNAASFRTYEYFIFDNGTSRDTTFDNTPGIVWSSLRNDYNATSFRTYEYYVFDNGTSRDTTFDNTLGIAWSSLRNDYNAASFKTYEYFVFDNGTSRDTTFDNTPGVTWQSLRNDYNALSQKTYEYYVFDNGTSRETSFDYGAGQIWKSLRADYTATSQLSYQYYVFDNNTSRQVVYDVANLYSWATQTTNYDTAGNVVDIFYT